MDNEDTIFRPLTQQEIDKLKLNGCTADDWANVSVANGFLPERVVNTQFAGECRLGANSGIVTTDIGICIPAGIRNARIVNSTIGDNCLIENISGFVFNCDIMDNCLINNVASIQTTEGTTFGQGNTISVLNEAGDGNVVLFGGLTSQMAALTALPPCLGEQFEDDDSSIDNRRQAKEAVRRMVMEEVTCTVPKRTLIESHVRIQNTTEITNSWITEGTEIRGAQRISECSLISEPDNSVFIGAGAICDGCVITSGSSVSNNAIAKNCFIGECSTLTDGFSATDSLFFANSYMANGEACAAFCGPFTVSHHKSTLLIGGMYSFYNAGSNTNFSNHAYKMGPIHYGIMEHGAKTASGAHILWPAHIGPFSMCMGKISNHPDTSALPFSYVIGDGTDTYIVPGRNIATVGTYRDVKKWPKRDIRPENGRHSIVDTSWLNAFTIERIVKAKFALESMLDRRGRRDIYECPDGCLIKKSSLHKGISLYSMATKMYLAKFLDSQDDELSADNCRYTDDMHTVDLSGLLISQKDVLKIVDSILNGDIDDISSLKEILNTTTASMEEIEKCLALKIANALYGWNSLDNDDRLDLIDSCRQAHEEWLAEVRRDAEKEYELGDVSKETLDNFISKLS